MSNLGERLQSALQTVYHNKFAYTAALAAPAVGAAFIGKSIGGTFNRMLTMSWCMGSMHLCPIFNEDGEVNLSLDKRYTAMYIMGAGMAAIYAAKKVHGTLKTSLPEEQVKRPIKPMRLLNAGLSKVNSHLIPRSLFMLFSTAFFATLGVMASTSAQQSATTVWCESAGINCPDYDMDGNVDIWAQKNFKAMFTLGLVLGAVGGLYVGYQALKNASKAHLAELAHNELVANDETLSAGAGPLLPR